MIYSATEKINRDDHFEKTEQQMREMVSAAKDRAIDVVVRNFSADHVEIEHRQDGFNTIITAKIDLVHKLKMAELKNQELTEEVRALRLKGRNP